MMSTRQQTAVEMVDDHGHVGECSQYADLGPVAAVGICYLHLVYH